MLILMGNKMVRKIWLIMKGKRIKSKGKNSRIERMRKRINKRNRREVTGRIIMNKGKRLISKMKMLKNMKGMKIIRDHKNNPP